VNKNKVVIQAGLDASFSAMIDALGWKKNV
jgi:hypothetical protein